MPESSTQSVSCIYINYLALVAFESATPDHVVIVHHNSPYAGTERATPLLTSEWRSCPGWWDFTKSRGGWIFYSLVSDHMAAFQSSQHTTDYQSFSSEISTPSRVFFLPVNLCYSLISKHPPSSSEVHLFFQAQPPGWLWSMWFSPFSEIPMTSSQ